MRISRRHRRNNQRIDDGYDLSVEQEYDEAKFCELLVLVADRLTADEAGGATNLNKGLYFADFAHVRRTGGSITGADYQKLANGPAPRRLLPVRNALVQCGDAELAEQTFLGYRQNRLIPRRTADTSLFDTEEMTPAAAAQAAVVAAHYGIATRA